MTNGKPKLETLSNGMRLVTVDMPGIKSLTVMTMVGVGSRFETAKKAGISHFLEHLPFKGTKNYPTSLDVSTAIDGVGGKHNAFTGKEYTAYWVKVAGSKWELAVDVVSDLLLTARLREKDIEREKGVIVEEINMYEDNPQYKVANLFDDVIFRGSSLGWDIAGSKETVTSMTQADFMSHWDDWYSPSNIVVALVGEIPEDEMLLRKTIEKAFGKGDVRPGGGEKKYEVVEQTEPRMNIFYKDTEQAHFYLGFPGISRLDKDRQTLSVFMTMLGGNSSSWMFNEIREKRGLAYYAYASADLHQDTGSIYAFEGVATDKIEDAIKVTIEQFERAKDGKDITDDEVARAKEYVMGKLILDLEDSSTVASVVVRKALLENKVESVEEVLERVKSVKAEDVRRVAKQLIDLKKMNLAVVGPYKKAERFEDLVGS